jgi:hypothetical protein
MAIIIGDIHGNLRKARAFLSYAPEETHVALGDFTDGRGPCLQEQIQCLELMIQSNSIMLWGNHDLQYLTHCPWVCSPFSEKRAETFRNRFDEAKRNDRFIAAYAIDGWLCTHAGVAPELAENIPNEYRNCVDTVACWLNLEFERGITLQNRDAYGRYRYGVGPLFNCAVTRGGDHPFGGIFLFDCFHEGVLPSSIGKQLFGHIPRSQPEGVPGQWWALDVSQECWIFDTSQDKPVRIAL